MLKQGASKINMARMYSRRKGKSRSKKPAERKIVSWLSYAPKEVEQLVIKLGKSGLSASMTGTTLRDSYGIPDVKVITNKKITRILEEQKLTAEVPEDILALIKKDINVTKHTEQNNHDMVGKRGKQLVESRIRRLANYYKRNGKLPKDWTFDLEKAKLLIG